MLRGWSSFHLISRNTVKVKVLTVWFCFQVKVLCVWSSFHLISINTVRVKVLTVWFSFQVKVLRVWTSFHLISRNTLRVKMLRVWSSVQLIFRNTLRVKVLRVWSSVQLILFCHEQTRYTYMNNCTKETMLQCLGIRVIYFYFFSVTYFTRQIISSKLMVVVLTWTPV